MRLMRAAFRGCTWSSREHRHSLTAPKGFNGLRRWLSVCMWILGLTESLTIRARCKFGWHRLIKALWLLSVNACVIFMRIHSPMRGACGAWSMIHTSRFWPAPWLVVWVAKWVSHLGYSSRSWWPMCLIGSICMKVLTQASTTS